MKNYHHKRCSHVMHIAHANWQLFPWQTRLERAWELQNLCDFLPHGIVMFTYRKSDGSQRRAVGTRYSDLIPYPKRPAGTRRARIDAGIEKQNYTAISYFDLEKQDWRSFSVDHFCRVEEAHILSPYDLASLVNGEKDEEN